jgi:hypothetical protein
MWMRRSMGLGSLLALIASCSNGGTVLESKISRGPDQGGAGGGGAGGELILPGGATGQGGTNHVNPDAACAVQVKAAEALPVDMYIMFDQSSSMGDQRPDNSGTWWAAAQAGVMSFVNSARATNMGVGLQYFPLSGALPACAVKNPNVGDCCTAAVYEKPEVDIGVLPGNAAALTVSIQAHQPTGFTPTWPALQGAIDHMKTWAGTHLGRAPVVVLVTDGFPTECDPSDPTAQTQPSDLALQVKTAFETEPKIRTFVVGINLSQGRANLDQIANAGGTSKAFLIDGGNIGDAFTNAMLSIASVPLQCSFDLPTPDDPKVVLDKDKVDVSYTPSATRVSEPVAKLNNLGDCSVNQGQGWYYDSPGAPTKILICPGTCARFAAGSVQLLSGCAPVIDLTR